MDSPLVGLSDWLKDAHLDSMLDQLLEILLLDSMLDFETEIVSVSMKVIVWGFVKEVRNNKTVFPSF